MIPKNTFLATLLGLGFASAVSADTIYVTGSTAFRVSFSDAVVTKMLTGGTVTAAYSGTSFNSAAMQVISGNIDGTPTVIKTNWTGSVEGVQAVVEPANRTENYLTNPALLSLTRSGSYPTYSYSGGTNNLAVTGPGVSGHIADLAMSDCFQNSTVYTSPALVNDYKVCVIPFKFIASENSNTAGASATGFDNITPLQAQLLWGSGRVSLSLFTFNSADNKPPLPSVNIGKEVFAMGRANTSGTRLVSFAEMGRGALSNAVQYSFSGTAWTSQGNSGSGASTVATQLGLPASSSTGYGIGYLGLTDAANAITAGARELKWNGNSYSAANVQNGKYSFWAYEHLYANNDASQAALDVAASLAAQISNEPGAAGLSITGMNVQRNTEGSLIDLND